MIHVCLLENLSPRVVISRGVVYYATERVEPQAMGGGNMSSIEAREKANTALFLILGGLTPSLPSGDGHVNQVFCMSYVKES